MFWFLYFAIMATDEIYLPIFWTCMRLSLFMIWLWASFDLLLNAFTNFSFKNYNLSNLFKSLDEYFRLSITLISHSMPPEQDKSHSYPASPKKIILHVLPLNGVLHHITISWGWSSLLRDSYNPSLSNI